METLQDNGTGHFEDLVNAAIWTSIMRDCTVTICPDSKSRFRQLAAELARLSENWTETGNGETDYWGEEDGESFRIYLRQA